MPGFHGCCSRWIWRKVGLPLSGLTFLPVANGFPVDYTLSTKVPMSYQRRFYLLATHPSSTQYSPGCWKRVSKVCSPVQLSTPFTNHPSEILIIVPPVFYGPISDHLAENFSSAIHPRARLNLKKHTDGEKEEEENDSSGIRDAFTEREGTARLLRRFKNQIRVQCLWSGLDMCSDRIVRLHPSAMRHFSSSLFDSSIDSGQAPFKTRSSADVGLL